MRPRTAQSLVSLFRSAARLTSQRSKTSTTAAAAAAKKKPSSATKKKPRSSSSSEDAALKEYVSSINSSSSAETAKCLLKYFKAPPSQTASSNSDPSLHAIFSHSLNPSCSIGDDESAKKLSDDATSMLYGEMNLDWDDVYEDKQRILNLPWFLMMPKSIIPMRNKEFSRERKQKWVFKNTQTSHFGRLVNMCAKKLGTNVTIEVFGKLGKETGLKEYAAVLKMCIQTARDTTDEDVSLEQIYKAYQILKVVKEKGFKIEEDTYGQLLMYLVDFGMEQEFFFFCELIKDENPDSLPRLAYYEMLLWVRINNKVKIQELCQSVVADEAEEKCYLQECLLLALCGSDFREEFLMLLGTLNITKIKSGASLECIFRSLGKFLLEPYMERFLLALKGSDTRAENISNFIYEYAISIPNLAVEDIILKFQNLHSKLEVLPPQYDKLIRHCCESLKVHEALNVVDEAFESGVALSLETFHAILDACDRSCEFNLVHQINSRISSHNLKRNSETFRRMIYLCVKMKDFEEAYGLISDMQKMNVEPTAGVFNTILSGYFREKNIQSAMNVLKQMKDANVKPDAVTYSYLIGNSHHEEDINKFYDEMRKSGVLPTKQVFMALINAYASCGQFNKAKQVILDERIPVKNIIEIKRVLMAALASSGQFSGALEMYEEIKESKCDLDPKSIKCLIEHFQSEGDLDRSLQLLNELKNSPYWTDACYRIISHCVRHENLRVTVDLLKQVKDRCMDAEVAIEVLFDEVFCLFAEKEPLDMQFGLNLLKAIKEELEVKPSRQSLDFLLSACVSAKDSKTSFVIWKEYETAGLPYNVLSYVRMYQALLASGDRQHARKILSKMPKDDPHVRCVNEACKTAYSITKKKKNKRALAAAVGLLGGLEAKTR